MDQTDSNTEQSEWWELSLWGAGPQGLLAFHKDAGVLSPSATQIPLPRACTMERGFRKWLEHRVLLEEITRATCHSHCAFTRFSVFWGLSAVRNAFSVTLLPS